MKQHRVVIFYLDKHGIDNANKTFEELAQGGWELVKEDKVEEAGLILMIYRFEREIAPPKPQQVIPTHNCHCFLTPPYTVTCAIGQPTPTILK